MSQLPNFIAAYEALLKIPSHNSWRIRNQNMYSKIRDEIACITKCDEAAIQNSFETVNLIKNMKME